MLCTSCRRIVTPNTWIPGSERVELAAWCSFGAPGWLYCAWRHHSRVKFCPHCSSIDLMREARATQRPGLARTRRAPSFSAEDSMWPPPLHEPRHRMQRGAAPALLGLVGAGAILVAGVETAWKNPPAALAQACALWSMSWMFVQIALFHPNPLQWTLAGPKTIEREAEPAVKELRPGVDAGECSKP